MWGQAINVALGIWLMASPAVLAYGDPARTNGQVVGPLIAAFATVACWEATRPLRWVNLPLGAWMALSPLALGFGGVAAINSVLVGMAVAGLSFVRGRVTQHIGGGWSAIWSRELPVDPADRP